jgi:hypothetical protein
MVFPIVHKGRGSGFRGCACETRCALERCNARGLSARSLSTRARLFPPFFFSSQRARRKNLRERGTAGHSFFLFSPLFLFRGGGSSTPSSASVRFPRLHSAPLTWFSSSLKKKCSRPRTPSSARPSSARPGPSPRSRTGARRAPRPRLRSPCWSTAPTSRGPSPSSSRATPRPSPPRSCTRRWAAA